MGLSGLLLSGLFIGALAAGVGLNAVYASPQSLLGYYGPVPPVAATGVTAVPGNGTATVRWAKPLDDGGSTLTGYVVTPQNGFFVLPAQTFLSPSTAAVVTGLTNGKAYSFKVAAINSVGTGLASLASNTITAGAPTAPTSVVASLPANGQVTLKWVAPVSNNGAAVTTYVVTPYIAGVVQTIHVYHSTATTDVVRALTNGKSYTFRVTAKNARGSGAVSGPSNVIVVSGVPAAPTGVHAGRLVAGQLRVTFLPGADHGSAITSFTATCTSSNGGVRHSNTGTKSPIVVPGLTAHKSYTCKVKATNGRGTGLSSSASAAVTP